MSAPHIERMEAETAELLDRHRKLHEFMAGSGVFAQLDAVDQTLLRAQAGAMKAYSEVLQLRLSRAHGGSE